MTTADQPEHLSGYQARDEEVVDYQLTRLPGTELTFRGPLDPRAVDSPAVACLGAAQTFGCFTDRPFPALLAGSLDAPVLNLGYGGAGPRFFLRHPELVEQANRAAVVVVQVMSGRSESNSLYDSGGLEYLVRREDGARVSAQQAYRDVLVGPSTSRTPAARVVRRLGAPARRRRTARLVSETRQEWVSSYRALLAAVTAPTVLLWFSRRPPDYVEDYRSVATLFGHYPQLVRRDMVEAVRPLADHYVECTTARGLPQPLVSRFTGRPTTVDPARDRPDLGGRLWTHNDYYPSPEMHQDVAAALEPVCRALLAADGPAGADA